MTNRYKKLIDSASIVSFDIFDTLITRKISVISDVFDCVEKIYNKENAGPKIADFRKKRIEAESELRGRYKREITIDEIYDELDRKNINDAEALKRVEIQTELDIAIPIDEHIEILNYAVSRNKKVFIISDMYLHENTVAEILVKCGVKGYTKLYVSSDTGYKKSDGSIYFELRKKYKKEKWVHFGDNLKSDFIMAVKNGITPVNIRKKESGGKLRIFDKNLAKKFGYNIFGPLCYGYAAWLDRSLKKEEINKVFFFSREGFFLKRIYEEVFNENTVEKKYLYVSRKSLVTPVLQSEVFFSHLELFRNPGNKTAAEYLHSLGLSEKEVADAMLDLDLKGDDDAYKVLAFKEKIRPFLLSTDKYDNASRYLESEGCEGRFAIVDIGWTGTMQIALSELLKLNNIPNDIHGYFIGQRPEMKQFGFYPLNNKGYLCSYNDKSSIQNELLSGNCLFELLCMAPHGTCDGYAADEKGRIVPVLKENEYGEQYNIIKTIQDYACLYLHDRKKYYPESENAETEYAQFRNFLRRPSKAYAEFFGDIYFFDSSLRKIAEKTEKRNILNLIKGYYSSYWKVGFLRRNIFIRLPYIHVYIFTRWIGSLLH